MFDSGQTLFTKQDPTSIANMDKQIFRLIGKATTFAAYVLDFVYVESDAEYDSCCSMAYRIRQGRDFVTPPTGLSYTGS
jgi:citrate synthase